MSAPTSPAAPAPFAADLIRKYDVSGPRYTSYPTAAQFSDRFAHDDYRRAAGAGGAASPLSLYVHVPFCATVCYYCACNRVITRNVAHARAYLDRLEREIARQAVLFVPGRPVTQLHWGGGTPTFLDGALRGRLMQALIAHFRCAPDAECSIEIDPRACPPGTLAELADLGFNRVSFGVQDFEPRVQVAVNRVQSQAVTVGAVNAARRAGFRSINLDLIYGLPHQTRASFRRTLSQVLALRPERLSIFNYAHLPQLFKTQRRIDSSALPTAGEKLAILDAAVEMAHAAGYVYIGMDHFALPHDELAQAQRLGTLRRNFQGYSTHAGSDLIGFGMSAISMLEGVYCQNAKTLPDYQARIDDGGLAISRGVVLTADDRVRRAVIMRLACAGTLDCDAFERAFALPFEVYFAREMPAIAALVADGLLEHAPPALAVTPRGRFVLRQICMIFDRYLGDTNAAPYSRAI